MTAATTDQAPTLVTAIDADMHTHFLTERYVAEAVAAGITHPDNMPGWPSWSLDDHRDLLDRTGVTKAYLSISSPGVHFGDDTAAADLARHVNNTGAGYAHHEPARFGHLASVPLPDVTAAVDEARRSLDDLGSAGIAVMTHHGGRYLGHPSLDPLWAELDSRAAVVFVHPTSPAHAAAVDMGRPHPMVEFIVETARTVSDLALTNAFDRFGRIRWIFSHGGGALPLLADRIELFRTTILADHSDRRPVTEQLRDVWFDLAGTPFPHQVPAAIAAFGDQHLLYGSDACWTTDAGVEHQVNSIDNAQPPLDGGSWRELLNRNSADFFS